MCFLFYFIFFINFCSTSSHIQNLLCTGFSFSALETELKVAKEQLVLLHMQLQFERHRREVHAERNRRLLGKSRTNRALEEHNSALVSVIIFKLSYVL